MYPHIQYFHITTWLKFEIKYFHITWIKSGMKEVRQCCWASV